MGEDKEKIFWDIVMPVLEKQAVEAAEEVISTVWDQDAPNILLPVDPVRISRELGISVYKSRLDSKVSGAIVKELGKDPKIMLNEIDSRNRQRFTCAQELGHFVRIANSYSGAGKFEYVDFRGTLSSTEKTENEVFADMFAASLLMPTGQIRNFYDNKQSSVALAYKFGVPAELMHFRLKSLGLE